MNTRDEVLTLEKAAILNKYIEVPRYLPIRLIGIIGIGIR